MSNSTTPFREPASNTSAIGVQPIPPRIERFFAWLLPAFLFSSCRWYRRASGGRWSQVYSYYCEEWAYKGCRRMPHCRVADGSIRVITGCTDKKCICESYDP